MPRVTLIQVILTFSGRVFSPSEASYNRGFRRAAWSFCIAYCSVHTSQFDGRFHSRLFIGDDADPAVVLVLYSYTDRQVVRPSWAVNPRRSTSVWIADRG